MIKDSEYIKLDTVLAKVLRHKKLRNVTLDDAVEYTVEFMGIVGVPDMFMDKEAVLHVSKYKVELPCDLVSVTMVKDNCSGIAMRSTTDRFAPDGKDVNRYSSMVRAPYGDDKTYKVQNHILVASFEEGDITVAYKAIPVDDDGYPLIQNNPIYLKALELYIKVEVFTDLYDDGDLDAKVLSNAQADYAWRVGQLQSELTIPNTSEMESLCRSWCTLIPRTTEFDSGFKHNGNREYLRRH